MQRALASPARLGCTRLIALDGPAGSGKTTLAAALSLAARESELTCAVVHMDDLYRGWTGLNDELEQRVVKQIIRPLASSRSASWQQYDWHAERFDAWHDLPVVDVLILEGCGSGARALASYTTLLVWLEAAPDERIRRGVARDGPEVLAHWHAWMRLETGHFDQHRTKSRADVRLRTDGGDADSTMTPALMQEQP